MLAKAHQQHPADRDILVALTTMHRDRGDRNEAKKYASILKERYPDDRQVNALWREMAAE